MKKILLIIILVLSLIASGLGVVLYKNIQEEKAQQEAAKLTQERVESFSKEELENHCKEYEHECEITTEHHSEILENDLIEYDLATKTFIYSKGDYPVETYTLSWGAVGDVIIYSFTPFWNGQEYNYDSLFNQMSDKTTGYDISSYTQESPAAGCTLGYPLFCSPYEFIGTMERAGFDIANTANNHTLDQGHDGLERSLDNFENYSVVPVGTYKQDDTNVQPVIYEHEEFTIGILSYAEHLNGFQKSPDLDHTISMYSKEKMESDVEYLNNQGVDFIISFMHWGAEYTDEPSQEQKNIAQELTNAKIDVILGSHSHSLNPVDILTSDDNSSTTLVAYSLGNYQASQHSYIFDTAYGGILEFNLNKQVKNNEVIDTSVDDIKFYPTFNKPHNEGLVIIPLDESNYSHKFDSICQIITMYEDIECYN